MISLCCFTVEFTYVDIFFRVSLVTVTETR